LKKDISISIVSPVFKAELIIDELVFRINSEIEKITSDYEIILVEDGSPENCWEKILFNCKSNKKVKGIKLSRNFGQHNAVLAGLKAAKKEVTIIMDCDLQDDPCHIPMLIKEYLNGHQIVFTKRINRKHNSFKKLSTKLYNFFFNFFADNNYDISVGSLVLLSLPVKKSFLKLKEHNSLYIQILKWLGYNHTFIYVEHRERFKGKTSYNFKKLIKMAIHGWVSNSEKLLYISIKIGFLFIITSILIVIYIVYSYLNNIYLSGWPSLICTIILCTGLILTFLGILGIYIGKIFNEVKDRPSYIVETSQNL
jgi:polyisoprenyl-phosphate glycosyltransferase